MSPPRLTGALRSFSVVSRKDDLAEQRFDLKVRTGPGTEAGPASRLPFSTITQEATRLLSGIHKDALLTAAGSFLNLSTCLHL